MSRLDMLMPMHVIGHPLAGGLIKDINWVKDQWVYTVVDYDKGFQSFEVQESLLIPTLTDIVA